MVLPLFLGPFVSAITGSLGWVARSVLPFIIGHVFSSFLARVLLWVVFLVATTVAVEKLLEMAQGYVSGLPGDVLNVMQLTGMINAMNIIASAYLFKLTLKIDAVKLMASKSA
ncbi:MAG: DUF2523 domain-containing protein [Magnetococcus sp. XQGC-1]